MAGKHVQRRLSNPPAPDYMGNTVQSKRYPNVMYSGYNAAGIERMENPETRGEWDEFEPAVNSGRHRAGDAPHPTLRTRLGLAPKVAPDSNS